MGVNIYFRSVPYSGQVPNAHAAQWAEAQSGEHLGNAVQGFGSSVQQMGRQQEEDERREAQINSLKAEADLDEYNRTFLNDLNRLSLTDENGASQHHRITEYYRNGYDLDGRHVTGYDERKQGWIKSLPEKMQATWAAELEARDEPAWNEKIEARGRELREDYITASVGSMLRLRGRAGDIMAAAALREQAKTLFPAEEWNDVALDIDRDIALGLAQYDEDLAHQYAKEFIPADKHPGIKPNKPGLDEQIEKEARAASARRQDAFKALQETEERKLAATAMRAIAGENVRGASPSEIAYKVEQGLIDPAFGYTWSERMQKARTDDRQKRTDARGIISHEYSRYVRGETSYRQFFSVLGIHGADLPEEEERQWIDRGNTVNDPYKSVRAEASQLAEKALKPLFPEPEKGQETAESPALAMSRPLGLIQDELDRYEAEQAKAGKPTDVAAYRAKAQEIIGKVYSDEYATQHPTKEKTPSKWEVTGSNTLPGRIGRDEMAAPSWSKVGQSETRHEDTIRIEKEKAKVDAEWADVDVDKELDYLPEQYRIKVKNWLKGFRDKRARVEELKKRVPRPAEGKQAVIVPLEGGSQ